MERERDVRDNKFAIKAKDAATLEACLCAFAKHAHTTTWSKQTDSNPAHSGTHAAV